MERPIMHKDGIHKMSYATLDASPRLAHYYETNERIEITWDEGWGMNPDASGKTRCYVGKSTGWTPCWLMLLRRNSSGGSKLDEKGIKSIRGLGIFR